VRRWPERFYLRADQQEVREVPARIARFPERLQDEPGLLERARVGLEWRRPAPEVELEPVPCDLELEFLLFEVVAGDHEPVVLETSGVPHGMGDADAEPAAVDEDACGFADRAGHVVDIHQRVEGDDEVEPTVCERQPRCVGDDVVALGIGLLCEADHRRRDVDTCHRVAGRRKVARDATFAATEIECPPTSRRQEREERLARLGPVRVVPGRASPGSPALGLSFPVRPAAHASRRASNGVSPSGVTR
jgi:hypothetical protein